MSDEPAPSGLKQLPTQRAKTLRQFYRSVFKKDKQGAHRSTFNPEEQFHRKKEWLENRTGQDRQLNWPDHCFEHLVIVGLPHTMDTEEVIQSIRKEKVKSSRTSSDISSASAHSEKPNHTPPKPSYTPQLLYQFPEDKPLHMNPDQLVSFCFPHGVTPQLLKRSPSMSALNQVVYGQQHFVHSDQSFVFLQKGGDDLPMFGVCYLVNQMLHTPPGLVKHKFREMGEPPSKHMVCAPRCYCLLSRYPFFELHFQVLNLVLGLERLDSISDYMSEIVKIPPDSSLFSCFGSKSSNHLCSVTPDPCAIRAFSASPTPPALRGFPSQAQESDVSSQTVIIASDGESPQTIYTRDSFSSQIPIHEVLASGSRHPNKSPKKQHCRSVSGQSLKECDVQSYPHNITALAVADSAYLPSEFRTCSTTPPSSSHRYTESGESTCFCTSTSMPDLSTLGEKGQAPSDAFAFDVSTQWNNLYRSPSLGVVRFPSNQATRGWSQDLQEIIPACQKLLCHFRTLKVPAPGEKVIFVPEEEGLQRIEYTRSNLEAEWNERNISPLYRERILIEEETALGLQPWTVAVLCRSLSLDNILSLLAGAMLERQIVFFCSNIGVLTSAVLALIPLLRPFAWQSLILPALPTCYLEFLEAPVPIAVGIQHKTPEIAQRCTDLIRVNLYKDKIKNAPTAHSLPQYKTLYSELLPWHRKLQECSKYSCRPSHVVTGTEYKAVEAFLKVLRCYLSGLLENLERHTITDVSSNDGVSLLLEDSLIESFPPKDQPFMKDFAQSQMFASYVDSIIGK